MTVDLKPNLTKLLDRNREIYACWFQKFMDNIHALIPKPSKWLKSGPQPVVGDIVLFVFTDGGYSKSAIDWKLGRVISIGKTQVEISYTNPNPGKDTLTKFTLWRNPRAVSIIHSVGDLDLNTTDHFQNIASLV